MNRKTKKFKLALLLLSQLIIKPIISQQNNWWHFGQNASINFNTNLPTAGVSSNSTQEPRASVCDASGNLLFYTDGSQVYKNNGQIMPTTTGNTTYSMSGIAASVIIVPKPGSNSIYYIFTMEHPGKVKYSIIDMSVNGGSVTSLTLAMPGYQGGALRDTEGTEAIKHCNGIDYWIITHEFDNNTFNAFLVSASGISSPVVSSAGTIFFFNTIKASPDGKLLSGASTFYGLELFNFDPSSGSISFNKNVYSNIVPANINNATYTNDSEFSPNSRYLYFTLTGPLDKILRYDTYNPNNALVIISSISVWQTGYSGIKLAPDGNIYVSRNTLNYLSKIANPNTGGTYTDVGFTLAAGTSCKRLLPSFPISSNPVCSTASFVFTNPGQTTVNENSLYGPLAVTQLCQTLPSTCVTINGSASENENAYFIGVAQFDALTWTSSTPMYGQWVASTQVPVTDINLCNLPGVSFQPNTLYCVRLAVGPLWNTEDHYIRINPTPTINAGPDQTICNGSSATLTVTSSNWPVNLYKGTGHGAFFPTSYTNPPIVVTPTVTTTYTLGTTNSAGCTAKDVVTVTVNNCPTACFNFSNTNQSVVNESSLYGPMPVTSICLPNVIIDGGCSTNENGYFISISEFNLSAWQDITPTFYEGWVTGTGPVPSSINLSTLIGTLSANTPNGTHTFAVGHVYKVGLAVGPIWNSITKFFRVKTCTVRKGQVEIEEVENPLTEINSINIYPNPTTSKFSIEFNAASVQSVIVYDAIGKVIIEKNVDANSTSLTIDLSDVKSGIYFAKMNSGGNMIMKKIIKE
ncbi:MAG: T9SS type A sorting domain-containing protein [Bacteroidota bacterium]